MPEIIEDRTSLRSNPIDRDKGFPSGLNIFQQRFFEILPGLTMWILLLLPVILSLLRLGDILVIYIAYIVAYWSMRTIKFLIGIGIGVSRMDRDINTDWVKKIKEVNEKGFEKLRFVYLCPAYAEPYELLDKSFDYFSKSDVGAEKIDVVMALEEKKQDLQIEHFNRLKKKYGKIFGSMRYYVHPAGIPGEISGVKGANINWASRHFVSDLKKEGKNIHDYLLVTCDSDLRPHHKYLSAIAYKYFTTESPDNTYYATAVHTFNNNLWHVPHLIRTQSSMLTLVILQDWVMEKKRHIPFLNEDIYVKDSFSSYVVNLETLEKFQFWDPEIANDDTAFYWNAMVRTKGTFKSEEVYIPTYNDAVEGTTYLKAHESYYKQQYRWGWGIVNVPITMAAMWKDKKTFPLYRKLILLRRIFENQIWVLTIVFVLTFGLSIARVLDPSYQFSAFSYNLSRLMGYIFTVITFSNFPIVMFKRKLSPIPNNWNIFRHIQDFAETFLITINMLSFGFIPYVQAQTEMMLGLSTFKRNFYVTEKGKPKE